MLVNKKDCSFEVLKHTKIHTLLESAYQVRMTHEGIQYLAYNTPITFKRPYELSHISCPRRFGKSQGKQFIEKLPETFMI